MSAAPIDFGDRCCDARPFTMRPLLAMSGTPSLSALAEVLGVGRWAVSEANGLGLTDEQADRWACALGFHPSEVWGSDWFDLAPAWNEEDE